jgi:hypothetical protein
LKGYPSYSSEPALARLLPNGSLDESFGQGGISSFPASGFGADVLTGLAQQNDGTVVTTGFGIDTSNPDFPTSGLAARFLLAAGTRDADADGRVDRKDRCPRVAGGRKDGCPALRVKITARGGDHSIGGAVRGPRECFVKVTNGRRDVTRLSIFRKRHRGDAFVGRARIDISESTWTFHVGAHGRYYATYGARQNGSLGHCTRAASRVIRPRHR